ncbi:MAG: hypothetical protein II153_03680, partial [Erysipelotrichaceae bacterium]|nr:hypothetical protein [Erysipelotrichaceae bacterium]
MLELHRLNNHKTMNFWRLSANISFSDFGEGDLVFFLSKDKEHRKKKEKGIVGFGRVSSIAAASIRSMWDRYGIYNGYVSLTEFKEAIRKVSKDKKLPAKISAFYLEDVTFFQPVYLSECGMKISNNVESYIYLKPEKVVLSLLDLANDSKDLWSGLNENSETISREKLLYALLETHKKIGDIPRSEKENKKAKHSLKAFEEEGYRFFPDSQSEICRLGKESADVMFYYDKTTDLRSLIGQAQLYKYYLGIYLGKDANV